MQNSWASVTEVIDTSNQNHTDAAGPGHWNDPDMLQVGNGGMTSTEDRTHYSLWVLMAAPLIAGNDLLSMSSTAKETLTNPEVIAIDQDSAGIQGKVVEDLGNLEVWSKPLAGGKSWAVGLLNRGTTTENITANWSEIGLTDSTPATIRNLWEKADKGTFTSSYTASVPSHGIALVKITVASQSISPSSQPVTPSISPSLNPTAVLKSGDTNNDGRIDVSDLVIVLQNWFTPLMNAIDAFGDGRINAMDFAQVLAQRTVIPTTGATPTPTPTSNLNSKAMGAWVPNDKFDTCPTYPAGVTTQQQKTAYIISVHDSFKVKGPDGKWYPTWHPPIDPATGCKFGHEHGKDPAGSPILATIKEHFAYKDPVTGQLDITHAGVPFGYVNETMDTWSAATNNPMGMRHEDHVGHKIEWAANLPIKFVDSNNPQTAIYVSVTCNYLGKAHQGTSTHDAFENNLHEVIYAAECSDGHKMILAKMVKFGKAGQFTRICDPEGDRDTVISTGFDYSSPAYPGTTQDGNRLITDRSCVINNFLVPPAPDRYSMNFYEAWPGNMNITGAQGQELVRTVDLLFDVEDAMRYYYPGKTHPEVENGSKYDNEGFNMELCYETLPNGNRQHGSACDIVTNYGQIKNITWDDPRSAFKGTHRGLYFKAGEIKNAGGPEYWYTDPFGENGKTTPFPGAIRQYIKNWNSNYAAKFGNSHTFQDPYSIDVNYSSSSVHAPN